MRDSMNYACERLIDVWAEVQPLLAAHWREIAHYQDIPLEPRESVYRGLDNAGVFRVYTARLDGQIVGYVAYVVGPALHYASSKQALQDVLFLSPEHRGARAGAALIDFSERMLKAEGVQVIVQHVKKAFDFSPLLRGMGYEEIESIHAKRLDHGN